MRWKATARDILVTASTRDGRMLVAPVLRNPTLDVSVVRVCGHGGRGRVQAGRRPQTSPLFRLLSDHFRAFHAAYEDRFSATYGDWRPVVREVADEFLAMTRALPPPPAASRAPT